MNPNHLATLLAVLDEGSFEAAADVLHITPSAVSQRIKSLEMQTGRVLLKRATPVEPTDSGEILAQAARRMALLQAETDAQLSGRLARVPLSVVVNADSLATWFRPVLADVAEWDTASLTLNIEDESASLSLLRRGDCLGAVTSEAKPVSGCKVHELGTFSYLVVANPKLRSKYSTHEGIDWASMPVLRFGPKDRLQDNDLLERVEALPKQRRVSQIPSSEAFIEATRVGLGWALLPVSQAEPLLETGELVTLGEKPVEIPLYWQHWRLESPLLNKLTESVIRAAALEMR